MKSLMRCSLIVAACATAACSSGSTARDGGSSDAVDVSNDLTAGSTCAAAATCGACAGVAGCGWCLTSGQCIAGDVGGSSDGTCMGPSWDFTGDLCGAPSDGGTNVGDAHLGDGGCVPTVARGGENSNALCSNGIDDDCNGFTDCNDYGCSRNPAVTICGSTRDAGAGCVPTVARGAEATNALCSNGIDDDCNGYIDCNDYHCSRNAAVTVCGTTDAGGPPPPPPPVDAGPATPIEASGGTVSLLHFAVFGDVRPPSNNDSVNYPSAIVGGIMANFRDLGAQFGVATGDYMFASIGSAVDSQVSALLAAESMYGGFIFHGMGNHECTGATASNCPVGNETPNIISYMSRLNAGHSTPYFDWVIHTSFGDAHFISTAPNAWSTAQQSWLTSKLAESATYTFVLAHEPPSGTMGPGSSAIDSAVTASGNVTIRLYGHTHEYRHVSGNVVIDGNAGAPLAGTGGSGDYYGFAMVDQRADGNVVFTAYQTGTPPTPVDSFVVTPSGTLTH